MSSSHDTSSPSPSLPSTSHNETPSLLSSASPETPEVSSPPTPPASHRPPPKEGRWKTWLKRVGVGGFFFFLIKGLLWLIIPFLLARGCLS